MLKLTRTLQRVLTTRSFAMATHRIGDSNVSRPRRGRDAGRVLVAYEDGEVLDDLEAFDAEIAALDTLIVRLMKERIDTAGDDRCDLAAFTF